MSLVRKNTKCLVCNDSKMLPYLDLGQSAFANSYLSRGQLKRPEFKAPLRVAVCKTCSLVQLLDIVDRKRCEWYSCLMKRRLVGFGGWKTHWLQQQFGERAWADLKPGRQSQAARSVAGNYDPDRRDWRDHR